MELALSVHQAQPQWTYRGCSVETGRTRGNSQSAQFGGGMATKSVLPVWGMSGTIKPGLKTLAVALGTELGTSSAGLSGLRGQ